MIADWSGGGVIMEVMHGEQVKRIGIGKISHRQAAMMADMSRRVGLSERSRSSLGRMRRGLRDIIETEGMGVLLEWGRQTRRDLGDMEQMWRGLWLRPRRMAELDARRRTSLPGDIVTRI